MTLKKILCLLVLLIAHTATNAQICNKCVLNNPDTLVYHVQETDTSAYTLSAGETLCIYSTGVFKGSVTLNGGAICNQGRFFPKTLSFNSGTIVNCRTAKIKTSLTLGSSRTLVNNPGSVLTIGTNLTVSGGTLRNNGMINTGGNVQNNSGLLENKAIINCTALTGTNSIINYHVGLVNTKN